MTRTTTIHAGQYGCPTLSKDGRTMTVHDPITLRHQGGRKQVVAPAGATPWIPTPSRVDNTIVKAIVRAHRWRNMLESGRHATVRDLANAEAINESYLVVSCASLCSHQPSSRPFSKDDSRPLSSSIISLRNSQLTGTNNSKILLRAADPEVRLPALQANSHPMPVPWDSCHCACVVRWVGTGRPPRKH